MRFVGNVVDEFNVMKQPLQLNYWYRASGPRRRANMYACMHTNMRDSTLRGLRSQLKV